MNTKTKGEKKMKKQNRVALPIMISQTAYAHGYGSAPWKTVAGLTPEEREAVRNKTAIVVYNSRRPVGGANGLGTTWREVYSYGRRFYHRVPSDEVIKALEALVENS